MQFQVFAGPGKEVIIELIFIEKIHLFLAAANAVEGRLTDIDKTAFYKRQHLSVQEGEKQGPDVSAINISIGHDDDFMVTKLFLIKLIFTDTASQCTDELLYLFTAENSVKPGLFNI